MKDEIKFENPTQGMRIDKFLSENCSEISRSNIAKLIDNGLVTIFDKTVKKSYKLKINDSINLVLPEIKESEIIAEDIPLNIIYEDSEIIFLNKPQGVVVHPGAGNYSGTLVNGLLYHCKDLKSIGSVIRPGVVHRIDKDTSGVLVFAKSEQSLNYLAKQFQEHTNKRVYQAIVYGITPEKGTIKTYFKRHPTNRLKYTSKVDSGKEAITHFKTLRKFRRFSYIELELETGRTHQIRVHLSENGFPILGDPLYGLPAKHFQFLNPNLYKRVGELNGQLLHAKTLGVEHPITKEWIQFDVDLPQYFNDILKSLEENDY
ncbi:RluA family pseudouridine synthase [bacterium]|nr:RluA family pseudouridine synthase [bacterium]